MIDDQHKFVQWLNTLAFRDLPALMERWLLGADPDGAEPAEQTANTGLSIRNLPGGMIGIDGTLDPIMGKAFRDAIATETEKIRAQHKADGIRSTLRRRQLEALIGLVATGFASPTRAGININIDVLVDQNTYEETQAWLDDPTLNPLPAIDIDTELGFAGRKSQLNDGTPIHPMYAVALSAKATFRRIVYDGKSRVIDVSYKSRSFPPWIRDLTLIATNGKSANPVCDAPFHWLQTDHIQPHSHGGQTSLENARPISAADNGWRSNDTNRGKWPMPDITQMA